MLCESSFVFGYTRDADDVRTICLFYVISDMYGTYWLVFVLVFLLLFLLFGTVCLPVMQILITHDVVNDM